MRCLAVTVLAFACWALIGYFFVALLRGRCPMTCTARLNGGVLACIRTDAHTTGHVYAASESPDRHTLTEPNGRES